MDKNAFLTQYDITENDLLEANISWEELALIAKKYGKLEKTMRELG